jgi:5-methylcytosine-specific restriction endonuclease McrA
MKTLRPRISSVSTLKVKPLLSGDNRLRGRAAVDRRARWLRLNPLCADCLAEGKTRAGDEVDHEVPLWMGGPDSEINFTTRCKDHHAAKTAREAAQRSGG